jgi:glycosyltransferase involved in cell wall biosynthesis
VPPNDPGALAQRIADLYHHPDRRKEFGRSGIRRVRASFTWSGVTCSIARMYEQVCGIPDEVLEQRVAATA